MSVLLFVSESAFELDRDASDEKRLKLNLFLGGVAVKKISRVLGVTSPEGHAAVVEAVKHVFGAGMLGQRKGKVPGTRNKPSFSKKGTGAPRDALIAVSEAMKMLAMISTELAPSYSPRAIATVVEQGVLKPLALRLMYEEEIRDKK